MPIRVLLEHQQSPSNRGELAVLAAQHYKINYCDSYKFEV
jgi:hypothetical protein